MKNIHKKIFETMAPHPQAAGRATIPALFERSVVAYGNRPVILFDDGSTLSYSEAGTLARGIAGRLQGIGVRKGDRVVSVSAACAEAALVFWAAALSGAVFIPVDHNANPKVLSGIIERTGPKALFFDPGCNMDRSALKGIDAISYQAGAAGLISFPEWLQEDGKAFQAAPVSPEDDAVVLFTSGTTGEPKGVVLSHGAICGSGRLMSDIYGWNARDRIFSTGDFHTMSGLRNPCIAALHAGASFIIAPKTSRADATACSELAEKTGATVLCTVPAFLRQFTQFHERITKRFTEHMRFVMCTGTALPETDALDFERLYGIPVLDYYGLTETAGICIGVPPGTEKKYRGTVGVPLGCEVRVAALDSAEAGPGETGVLEIRTDNFMSGYFGEQEAASKAAPDGWYRSADLCRRRPDGSIEILGRFDDAFKDRMGGLVHPLEIERALEESPLVLEAAACAFITEAGVPAAAAFIVPRQRVTDEQALAAELRRHSFSLLGPAKTPVLFRFVESLPRGTNGKILRRKLKEALP